MSAKQMFARITSLIVLVMGVILGPMLLWPEVALAQGPSPFLSTPYYNSKSITAYYDHTFPLSQNQNVRYFDGQLGTVANCDPGFNRAYATTGGQCLYYDGHEGIDFGLNYEPILAAASGTITQVRWNDPANRNSGYGLFIDIQHTVNVGGQNVTYTTRYGHLSSTAVSLNQVVQIGQIIGTGGSTGNTTGAHLHFGVINQNNQNTDPFGWTGGGADPSGVNSTCLWQDGEWANFCGGVRRPIPAPVSNGEITVNETTNNTGGFSKGNGGTFNNQCTSDCGGWTYSTNHYYTSVNGSTVDSWARWQPSGIPSGGAVYEVQVFIPNVAANTTSWQAPYKVVHKDGTSSGVIDQVGSRGKWISIGIYRMIPGNYVYLTDASGEGQGDHCGANLFCRLGADSVKFIRRGTVHAPDVRSNNNNWSSTLYLRSNGGYAVARANFRDASGSNLCTADISLAATANTSFPVATLCNNSAIQSAVIDSSQDLSVAVVQERSSPYTTDAYSGVSSPATEVRVPIVQRNNGSQFTPQTAEWDSDLFIQNAGSQSTNITLEFVKGPSGTNHTYSSYATLAAGGSIKINTDSLTNIGSVFIGSVRITNSANQPLAVASTQFNVYSGVSQLMETSNSQPLANVVYAPLLQNNNSSWLSGLTLSRSSSSSSFDLRYYKADTAGSECANQTVQTTNPLIVYPAPPGNPSGCGTTPNGVFKVNDGNITMVANVNQLQGSSNATTYAAISQPQKTAIIPKLITNSGWSDAFVIQNTSTSTSANVTIKYYNANGSLNSTTTPTVGAKRSVVIVPPANFNGSATVIADQLIAVSVNSFKTGNSGDIIGSYPAVHR